MYMKSVANYVPSVCMYIFFFTFTFIFYQFYTGIKTAAKTRATRDISEASVGLINRKRTRSPIFDGQILRELKIKWIKIFLFNNTHTYTLHIRT